ncbi:nucleoid-associated protein [Streptococcaceae bacterium ESL0687]|nr:nucleoid-associated protein [Streptococcaceae bacterium ESL0687]
MLDIYVKKAIIHSFDPGQEDLDFSEDLLDLTPSLLDYVSKKVEKVYTDKAKRGELSAENNFLALIGSDFLQTSKEIANLWQEEYRLAEEPRLSDLLFVEFEKDAVNHFAFMRMALRENFSHLVENQSITIKRTQKSLPGAGSPADEALIINLSSRRYHLIEKRIKYNGKTYNYLSENLLADSPDLSIDHAIKAIKKTAHAVAGEFNKDDFEFSSKVQNLVYSSIEENQSLDPENLADQFFSDNLSARLEFKDNLKEILPERVDFSEIPSQGLEKKLSNQKLSLSNGIELMVPQSLYDDVNSVEFIQEEDGSYSILIKNIEEIKNKW